MAISTEDFVKQIETMSVLDLSNLDHSLFTLAPGESGNALSRHYDDLLISWRNGTPETIVKPEEGVPVRTTILIPSTGG